MTAQVRPRTAWEAVDLGFMMLQHWYRHVIRGWLVITLPVFILINILLYNHPVLAAFTFWWLLPIFDRIPLHILSRALFGEIVTTRQLLKDWANILLPHLIKMLTFYRLDFTRSYNLPVWQLEKLKGRERAERARVLKKSQSSVAIGLGLMCLLIELVIFVSLFGLLMMLLPDQFDTKVASSVFNTDKNWWGGLLLNVYLYITFSIVEPFYVAGGFSLYINRRTELEGWDIEITFRQLAQRANTFARHMLLLFSTLVVFQFGSFVFSSKAQADELNQDNVSIQSAISNATAKKTIDKIMAAKEFKHRKKVTVWHLKGNDKEKKKETNNIKFNWFGLDVLGNTIALIGQLVLWVGVASLVALVIYAFLKWVPVAGNRTKHRRQANVPKSLFGLDITPESLPDDVGAAALALWRAGKVVDALSLLYRGALMTLVHRDGINLRGSATEGDCIRIIDRQPEKVAKPTRQFFQLLTRQWQYAAYAHRRPDEKLMSELCESWVQHFGVIK